MSKALGSIEGRIEVLSIHKQSRRFDVFQSGTDKAVRCSFPTAIEAAVFEAAEKRRRVVVSGTIMYNVKGDPIFVQVQPPIRFLRTEDELPTTDQLRGSDRDITEGLSTEEYIRSVRE